MTKYDELIKHSDPQRVAKNALDYFDKNIPIYISDKPNKKYMLRNPQGKYVHFGDINYADYTRTLDEEKQRNYLKRAMGIKGSWFKNAYSPNMLSIHLLWM